MKSRLLTTCTASLMVHVGSALWLARAQDEGSLAPNEASEVAISVFVDSTAHAKAANLGELTQPAQVNVPLPGGAAIPRPDTESEGAGGATKVAEQATNLAAHADALTRRESSPTELRRDQAQRLLTSRLRRSLDDRRATPNPAALSLVLSGAGEESRRLSNAAVVGTAGKSSGGTSEAQGGALGQSTLSEPGTGERFASAAKGAASLKVSAGQYGTGLQRTARRQARISYARPAVLESRAALATRQRDRPRDRVDSSLQVSQAIASLISTSTSGGHKSDAGLGGSVGRATQGVGGRLVGSRSLSHGSGLGAPAVSDADAVRASYFEEIIQHFEPYWANAFPVSAIAEGRSGIATVALRLSQDGQVSDVRIVRQSGVAEFDRNVTRAVHRAAPFPAAPAALGGKPISLVIACDAVNPAVGLPR